MGSQSFLSGVQSPTVAIPMMYLSPVLSHSACHPSPLFYWSALGKRTPVTSDFWSMRSVNFRLQLIVGQSNLSINDRQPNAHDKLGQSPRTSNFELTKRKASSRNKIGPFLSLPMSGVSHICDIQVQTKLKKHGRRCVSMSTSKCVLTG